MVTKIFNIIGWLGTALVLLAVLIRFGLPAREQYAYYLAWAGLVNGELTFALGQRDGQP